ncbi:hypothetical protein DFA_06205 [Cavenderia fasciculata]|uniref:Uncharacterized protein n=1 Tax=Cavenderia fasciculata TaxID=261658 RepID=F4PKE3_CACFS|nr:uncharacterized protein DFA_06205 [Cavenderia fasciculata]EGG24067.1 hypothetical protein DFA_06205 [Cavenderia fasciculata]|eukprot:XP_004361918.1 hypothetical protein DFA_06205 [Cavenderia fasciculata]
MVAEMMSSVPNFIDDCMAEMDERRMGILCLLHQIEYNFTYPDQTSVRKLFQIPTRYTVLWVQDPTQLQVGSTYYLVSSLGNILINPTQCAIIPIDHLSFAYYE